MSDVQQSFVEAGFSLGCSWSEENIRKICMENKLISSDEQLEKAMSEIDFTRVAVGFRVSAIFKIAKRINKYCEDKSIEEIMKLLFPGCLKLQIKKRSLKEALEYYERGLADLRNRIKEENHSHYKSVKELKEKEKMVLQHIESLKADIAVFRERKAEEAIEFFGSAADSIDDALIGLDDALSFLNNILE